MTRDETSSLYKKIDELTEALRHNKEAQDVHTVMNAEITRLEKINERLQAEVKRADDILCAISKLNCYKHYPMNPCYCCCENTRAVEAIVAEASRPLDKWNPGPV